VAQRLTALFCHVKGTKKLTLFSVSDEGWHGLCRLGRADIAKTGSLFNDEIPLLIFAFRLGGKFDLLRDDIGLSHLVAMTFQLKNLFA
jgi:hypothetical protein